MEGAPKTNTQYEHLAKGIKPIMTCLGTPIDFGRQYSEILMHFDHGAIIRGVQNINYHDDESSLKKKNFLNAGELTYVISLVDSNDKFTKGLNNCTSVVVVGIDQKTGKNISFITHQNPNEFLLEKRKKFIKDFEKIMKEISSMCVPKSVDAIILGGNYLDITRDGGRKGRTFAENYVESINLLSSEIEKKLKFKPEIINGPKVDFGGDNVYFDNKNRRVYFIRPEDVNANTQSFTADEFEKQKKEGF